MTAAGERVADTQDIGGLLRLLGGNHIQDSSALSKQIPLGIVNPDGELMSAGLCRLVLKIAWEIPAFLANRNDGIHIGIRCFDHTPIVELKGISYHQIIFFRKDHTNFVSHTATS